MNSKQDLKTDTAKLIEGINQALDKLERFKPFDSKGPSILGLELEDLDENFAVERQFVNLVKHVIESRKKDWLEEKAGTAIKITDLVLGHQKAPFMNIDNDQEFYLKVCLAVRILECEAYRAKSEGADKFITERCDEGFKSPDRKFIIRPISK